MKNFQQNLLILLALGLCALCTWQWYGQAQQRSRNENLNQLLYEKSAAIQGYTNSITILDRQVAQLDSRITELKETIKITDQVVVAQKREIVRLQFSSEVLTNQIAEYKQTVDTLNSKLKEAYDGINKQNESLKDLVIQRDEFVKKYNDSVKERNDIVAKYNELVAQVEKLQTGGKQ